MSVRTLLLTILCLTIASCGAKRGAQANTALELRGRLVQAGVDCTGFRDLPAQVFTDSEGQCTISGEKAVIATFSRTGALANWEDMTKATGCGLAATGTADKYVWVRGINWTIRPQTRAVARLISDKIGGTIQSPGC